MNKAASEILVSNKVSSVYIADLAKYIWMTSDFSGLSEKLLGRRGVHYVDTSFEINLFSYCSI